MEAINLRVWLVVTFWVAAAGISFAQEVEEPQILAPVEVVIPVEVETPQDTEEEIFPPAAILDPQVPENPSGSPGPQGPNGKPGSPGARGPRGIQGPAGRTVVRHVYVDNCNYQDVYREIKSWNPTGLEWVKTLDQQILAQAKRYADQKLGQQPTASAGAGGYIPTPTKSAKSPWLLLSSVALIFVIIGCGILINREHQRRRVS